MLENQNPQMETQAPEVNPEATQQMETQPQPQPKIPQTEDPFVAPNLQPEVNQQMQQPQPNMQANPQEIELAKKLLGLDAVEQQAKQALEELNRIKQERVKQEVLSKYPDVTEDIVNQEIQKLAKINPQLAEAVKTDPEAFEVVVKSALASITPNNKPDRITETGGSGNNVTDDLESKVKKGQADDITLGDYILSIAKK